MWWFSFMVISFASLIPFLIISFISTLVRRLGLINRSRLHFDNLSELKPLLINPKKFSRSDDNRTFEVFIYRLASKRKGRLSTAQIVVESGIPTAEVDKRMEQLVDNVHINMEIQDSGIIVYEFPEFLS